VGNIHWQWGWGAPLIDGFRTVLDAARIVLWSEGNDEGFGNSVRSFQGPRLLRA